MPINKDRNLEQMPGFPAGCLPNFRYSYQNLGFVCDATARMYLKIRSLMPMALYTY